MNYITCKSLLDEALEFRQAYNIPNGKTVMGTQLSLIAEEYDEFTHAVSEEPVENQLKELADLVYVCFQMAASQDWDLDTAMTRVHQSNLSKLGEDGKPIYREDGKVLKGPNYAPPILNDLT